MILSVQRQVHDAISEAIRTQFGVADVPPFAVEVPPTRALGDLAVPVAFQLARTLRKAPQAIAQELAQALGVMPGIARIVATPNGYLNLFLERPAFFTARVRRQVAPAPAPVEKTIVEHTAINPNKAAHIGHLRNAALGDTLVRGAALPRHAGRNAELHRRHRRPGRRRDRRLPEIERRSIDEVRTIADTTRFDYYCWDLYSQGHRVVRRRQGAAGDPRRGPARPRARRQRHRRDGHLHRRSDRARPSEDDGAAEHRLRPADLRGRHPAAAVLGACVRDAEGAGRGVPADRRQAGRLLGDADRGRKRGEPSRGSGSSRAGWWDEGVRRRCRPSGGRAGRSRAARKGDRALERRGHLRRQGSREPVLEVRSARPATSATACLRRSPVDAPSGRRRPDANERRRSAVRPCASASTT